MSEEETLQTADERGDTDDTTCDYQGQDYSVGAVLCMNGREFVCQTDGTWGPTGGQC